MAPNASIRGSTVEKAAEKPRAGRVTSFVETGSMAYHASKAVLEDRFAAIAQHVNSEEPEVASAPADARLPPSDPERSLAEAPESDELKIEKPKPSSTASSASLTRRAAKIALGLAVVGALGWVPLRALLATTSVEALVNARIETFRSPIEGIVAGLPDGVRGSDAAASVRIVNPLADQARLDDLRRQRETLDAEARGLERQSELANAELATLDAQIKKFRDGRLRLLDARLSTQTAAYEAAAAKATQAAADKRRTDALSKSGSSTVAESDRRLYEWLAASSTEAADKKRLEETRVERDALADGVFVGDSYNDTPSSQQQATELRLKAGEIDARAKSARSQISLLNEQIGQEEDRLSQRSEALVVLPPGGRVWEMLTSPGERVSKGQELMRVLDCSHPLVTANVDENIYNRLEVGGHATFKPAQGGGKTYDGEIANLTGAAAASGNFAIPLSTMRKTSFYVTVSVDGMKEGACAIGRTGTVTFSEGDAPANPFLKGVASLF